MADRIACPICGQPDTEKAPIPGRDSFELVCCNCGRYWLSRTALSILPATLEKDRDNAARLSHAVARMQDGRPQEVLGSDDIKRLIEGTSVPTPAEQADNLITFLGQELRGLGDFFPFHYKTLRGVIGAWGDAKSEGNVLHLINALIEKKTLTNEKASGFDGMLGLTFDGWNRHERIRRRRIESKTAFMAMQFGNAVLDQIVEVHFKPAVKSTGFDLFRLDERPEAGVIDNHMRARIRMARFVVADLTDANLGAYWEAGFAEGLDRPVIYTCEKKIFDDPKTKPHFDTNHCQTVRWDESDPQHAAKELAATIRATLPTEAIPEGKNERD